VQADILDVYPDADVAVYAVWFNMLPSDDRRSWDPDLLSDPRVSHYWDEPRELGRWYAEYVPFFGGSIAWDIFYLYGPQAEWTEGPDPLIASGYTLFGERMHLLDQISPLIDGG
jgi:hypothetical protein